MIVSDTGPLIVLFKTDLLFILEDLYPEVLVPKAVKTELIRKTEGIILFNTNPWIKVKEATDKESMRILSLTVDLGEAEAIALALELNSMILIDEKKGRSHARNLNLAVRGTLGLFLEAKKKGKVKSVKECINKLKMVGYYLDDELINALLITAGEA